MSAEYQVNGSTAIITLHNPPVNGLGHATRQAIVAGMKQAQDDATITAIIITGAGKAFSGGADIKEFNSPKAFAEPGLHSVISIIESSEKPVIAAIHSVCMGGGLELALGCHYRIASPGAQIALPEVKLGILPGAGGTQRLPRVVGLELALNMIVSGTPIASEKLAKTGLFSSIAEGDLMTAALALAEQVADQRPLPRVRDIKIDYPNYEAYLQFTRNTVRAMAGPFPAPLKCVEAVAAAMTRKFDDGIQIERALFLELVQSTESKALRHAFFGERAASKLPDVPDDTPLRSIKTVAVIGAGTMGGGIAMNFANAGIPVQILEMKQEALDKGLATIRKNYENTLKKGKLTQEKFEQRVALITGTLSYEAIGQADLVIEAVFEDMGVKEQVFRKLDEVMKPGAILASNTSTLDVDQIAAFTKRPQDVVGTHFFSPANVMKLLEIVRGKHTAKDVLATVLAISKKIKKTGVVSGVCDGFIGNRMIEQYSRQAGFLLEEGCTPEQIDKAVEKMGFAMGPFRMGDLAGNDIGWYIRKRRYLEKPQITYSKTADLLCEMGRYGQKTGAGWYDYKAGDRKAYPSELVNQMIIQHSADIGVVRRKISDTEIIERLIYSLVNEAAYILEEGIATRASDIDMVYLTGYGFPLHTGGPMFYADTVGLGNVVLAMEKYAKGRHGDAWITAPLLATLAAQGKTFN
ncbi:MULTISPECIES: 3-hydroxyacyl-CoA dehydrogenase NAD-binding domain-containing protein [unclassified Undibacterium]|uniref:3-hydroxyacyl-CoA dehydrogenase NAD-binding domain-containing protein n=1 Tax=unclassified Undibacterium TaxID=2630295 RepID=UPI002AC9A5C3|nr:MULTISPECIES: 3-hydroxyacyl-CoA dehydrogenase NAD-binding domain-containing protein [unclassified Undibacterium]MEB0139504.1 3-hydroxyacyl-CoA dehydrogenase NAD-binding domain-containing protein [Undibacterium sp. CCC2.1]MEB0172387.1 3-hydroxyacyl-CoA dehydrogenase NAD-binding domain-containing protein [Undibacterium sp. CCC1.1]MEB0175714.1 3-hydroxyacyl-CoA dehydrogenase NAD-binding domain-containing protein [Undibacterium sp. CCC3.4]MEB0214502.1 3-hydroxyacyl-CoA dehydrogenase NAD-binding 